MTKTKVYDWPTRLFHWSFAGLFLASFVVVKTIDDDSPAYSYHMLLGLVLAAAVILRVIWGLIGSRYARFSSFALSPSDLLAYLYGLLLGRSERRLGHNPASSWAALAMMALALGLAVTGFLLAKGGNKEVIEDIHEIFANAFIVIAIAHVAGVLLHLVRHRDGIAMSMVHGGKCPVKGMSGITRSHPGAGILYVALLGTFALHLGKNYDANTQRLELFGNVLQLGESEAESRSDPGEHATSSEQEHDDELDED